MMKKTISAICAVLLPLTAVSCQKSNVDQALDAQTNLVGTMQKSMTETAQINTLMKLLNSRINSSNCLIQ